MTTITSADGLTLEAAWKLPDEPHGMTVMCHPHPRAGGTMNAPLMLALCDDLVGRGIGVLRFNFRGIGSSEGESGDGIPEIADAEGALAAATERGDGPIAILGWSFGAAVAIRTAQGHPELAACVAIAPPVAGRRGWSAGLPPPRELELDVPTLVVIAEADDQLDPTQQHRWARDARTEVAEIKGANHFFWARYESLAETVGSFLEDAVAP